MFDNAYPLLQVYVQTLPNWFVFVHETLPFVGAVLEGSHVIAEINIIFIVYTKNDNDVWHVEQFFKIKKYATS